MKALKTVAIGIGGLALLAAALVLGFDAADRAFPPPLEEARTVSPEVVDADGNLLRAFATREGRWRLKTTAADVDPQYVRMLVAYEDRRFYAHHGIDFLALGRAFFQLATHGRIISGGSTLTMQVARLIEPRSERSMTAKMRQIFRALQLERRLSKEEILDLYLTHAPYGGNLEGVRAASLAYFGREPARLSIAQSALLVALPQLPERRRPDRNPKDAERARSRVLARAAVAAAVGKGEAERAGLTPVPTIRRQMPAYAAHLADTALRKQPGVSRHQTTLKRRIQEGLEEAAADAARRLGPKVSVAMVMADIRTGAIVGQVGSADYFNSSRAGWIDMTRALRSPGSTLKPFIYGLGFEQGYVAQQTIIEDRPADFYGYRPRNFDMSYQGDVSVRDALQLSLNVPAVRLLDAVGPTRLLVRFRRAGVKPVLPVNEAPGLAIALGGIGITLKDLVELYAGLANRGEIMRIGDGINDQPERGGGAILMEPVAAWNVTDILSDIVPPRGSRQLGLAYKTGTSYGNRDAWSVGYDGAHVLGVWVGRPDNGAIPGLTGYVSAAPILFDAFGKSGVAIAPFPSAPKGAQRIAAADLPISQKRFSLTSAGLLAMSGKEPAPQIVFPPEGARVDLGIADTGAQPQALALKLQGGRAPFQWLANGKPLPDPSRRRTMLWMPDGAGYSTLTVIDAVGRAASVRVFVE